MTICCYICRQGAINLDKKLILQLNILNARGTINCIANYYSYNKLIFVFLSLYCTFVL